MTFPACLASDQGTHRSLFHWPSLPAIRARDTINEQGLVDIYRARAGVSVPVDYTQQVNSTKG